MLGALKKARMAFFNILLDRSTAPAVRLVLSGTPAGKSPIGGEIGDSEMKMTQRQPGYRAVSVIISSD
ncbi:MAG: hypothetical protein WB783_13195 [Arenicellales bacterium]